MRISTTLKLLVALLRIIRIGLPDDDRSQHGPLTSTTRPSPPGEVQPHEDDLEPDPVGVKTVDGVVYLQGVVDSEQTGRSPRIDAQSPEVINVVNQLQVSDGRGVTSMSVGPDSRPS